MMRRERALETFDSGRVALGNIDSGNGEVRSRMEVFKALFIGE